MPLSRRCVLLIAALLVGLAAFAAGAVKLKPSKVVYVDDGGVGLKHPYGVGCGENVVAVADAGNDRLVLLGIDERGLGTGTAVTISDIPFPIRVDVAPSGDLFVLDGRSRRIGRVSPEGTFRGWVEIVDDGASRPAAIRSFALGPDGSIWALDVAGGRVLVLDEAGHVSRTIALSEDRGFPSDLAVDSRGDLYVVDSVKRRVEVARRDASVTSLLTGSLAEDLDFATSIATNVDGDLFLVDEHGGGIVVLGRDGTYRGRQLGMGWKEGLLRYPSDACVTAAGDLVVADRGNNRVQVFQVVR